MKKIRLKTMEELANYYVKSEEGTYSGWSIFEYGNSDYKKQQTYPNDLLGKWIDIYAEYGLYYRTIYTHKGDDLDLRLEKEHCSTYDIINIELPEDLFNI